MSVAGRDGHPNILRQSKTALFTILSVKTPTCRSAKGGGGGDGDDDGDDDDATDGAKDDGDDPHAPLDS